MKSELLLKPHLVLPDQQVIEIWYNGKIIGTVAGTDGPGVRVLSKHQISTLESYHGDPLFVLEVSLGVRPM